MATHKEYNDELNQRFQDFMLWAINHWPDTQHPLRPDNFAAVRAELALVTVHAEETDKHVPEPSEGGPQYVSVTPAPWP